MKKKASNITFKSILSLFLTFVLLFCMTSCYSSDSSMLVFSKILPFDVPLDNMFHQNDESSKEEMIAESDRVAATDYNIVALTASEKDNVLSMLQSCTDLIYLNTIADSTEAMDETQLLSFAERFCLTDKAPSQDAAGGWKIETLSDTVKKIFNGCTDITGKNVGSTAWQVSGDTMFFSESDLKDIKADIFIQATKQISELDYMVNAQSAVYEDGKFSFVSDVDLTVTRSQDSPYGLLIKQFSAQTAESYTPDYVSASSFSDKNHAAEMVADNDFNTSWCENSDENGVDENITFTWFTSRQITSMCINNGVASGGNRVKSLVVEFPDGNKIDVDLKDSDYNAKEVQYICFDDVYQADTVKLTIKSVYGSSGQTHITEVKFY